MIRRSVLIKACIFVVIAVLGIGYVLVAYVGIGQTVLGRQYTAYVDLKDSGGIFSTASVTYRGVEIGRVGTISVQPDGIRVAMRLSTKYRVPTPVRAVVAEGSAIGEQYIDLQPTSNDTAHHLKQGSIIPQSATQLPTTSQDVLVSLDRLVRSVPLKDLREVVTELGAAFNDTGPALRRLLDATHTLLESAQNDLPQTTSLLHNGQVVLDTQNDLSNDIVAFSRHLKDFTDTLRTSDPDIRRLITRGVPAATQVTSLIDSIDATLPVVLDNLVSVGQVASVRIPSLRQILVIYPYVVATSYGLFPNNAKTKRDNTGSTRFGVPIPPSEDQQVCDVGYLPSKDKRLPTELAYPKFRYHYFCKSPYNSGVGPRGSREAPQPDGKRLGQEKTYRDDTGLPGGGSNDVIEDSPATMQRFTAPDGRTYQLASTGGEQRVMGDNSWQYLIFGPLSS